MSEKSHEDPAVESGREVTKLMSKMLDMLNSVQSIVFEHDATIRDLQTRLGKATGRTNK
jgi:hypothetical protein